MADEKDVVCQVCGESLADGRPVVRCTQCQTAHHKDCWDYMGSCSTFGCPGTKGRPVDPAKVTGPAASTEVVLHIDAPPEPRPREPAPRSRQPAASVPQPATPPVPAANPRTASPVPLRPLNPGHRRRWSKFGKCRRFEVLRPWWVLRDLTTATIFLLVLPALVGIVGPGPMVALVVVALWLSLWPRMRKSEIVVDRKSRTLQRFVPLLASRSDICGFDDVVAVTCRSGGLLGQHAVVLALCDGSELVLGGFPDLSRAVQTAGELARTLTARLLVEA